MHVEVAASLFDCQPSTNSSTILARHIMVVGHSMSVVCRHRIHCRLLSLTIFSKHFFSQSANVCNALEALAMQVLLLLILIVLRSRISLVVALFYEAGKCLTSVPLLLIQPLWTFLILCAFFTYWFIVLLFIATLGTNWMFLN